MKTVVITGGRGGIGQNLSQLLLAEEYRVIILTRNKKILSKDKNLSYSYWNPELQIIEEKTISEADYIINLAGENIASKNWSRSQKNKILKSRIDAAQLLVKTIEKVPNSIKAVISASAIGFYGADRLYKQAFFENEAKGQSFLSDVCAEWENAIMPIKDKGIRLVILRTGVVFDKHVGALHEFLKPLSMRFATILGKGNQRLSWVHKDDITKAYSFALENENLEGIYNLAAPHPISYREAMLKLAKTKFGNAFIPVKVPGFVLKIMKGQMAKEMILDGTSVASNKIMDSGFTFYYPVFNKDCVRNLLEI